MHELSENRVPALRGPVAFTQMLLSQFLKNGDLAVDATCGNGHDTLLLAELCGSNGHVWGFDIQREAIAATGRRLENAGLAGRVTLMQTGHEELHRHVEGPLKAVCFNLGYLPGGDREIITRPDTTVAALGHAVHQLAPGGIVAITVYSRHPRGCDEKNAVESWSAGLAPQEYHCWRVGQLNVPSDAPFGIVIQKGA